MKVIGFDISSKNIGYAVLDNGALVDCGVIKPPKSGSIIARLAAAKEKVSAILRKHQPDTVAIEEIISFMQGKSTAKTIITLTSFNRMVGLTCFEVLGLEPTMLHVQTVRSRIKLRGKAPKKEEVPEALESFLGVPFPWILTKKKTVDASSYDLADAIAVALAA